MNWQLKVPQFTISLYVISFHFHCSLVKLVTSSSYPEGTVPESDI